MGKDILISKKQVVDLTHHYFLDVFTSVAFLIHLPVSIYDSTLFFLHVYFLDH